jgi:dihydroflavonol-4-reductase
MNAMINNNLSLVSGANGHLGNNLVRFLTGQGIPVRATVRNIRNTKPFDGLSCEVVQADITDKASFVKALQGVETFMLWVPPLNYGPKILRRKSMM